MQFTRKFDSGNIKWILRPVRGMVIIYVSNLDVLMRYMLCPYVYPFLFFRSLTHVYHRLDGAVKFRAVLDEGVF